MRRERDGGRDNRRTRPSMGERTGKRVCKYLDGVEVIDYKDHELLRKFMTERGKISGRRATYTSAKQQRQVKNAIRRARVMGLLP